MTDAEHTRPTERLWTPWRMSYIGGETREPGCIFCNRLDREDDIESLILHRMTHSFVIMNLYPYNTGHIMVVPNQHASDPAQLTPETLAEIGMVLPTLTDALRRAFGCQGFNVGLNIGAIAGAGVEAHLHQHIVPRWQGDANFMPILASTMTIPELIPVTYAKIRAELTREVSGMHELRFLVLDAAGEHVLFRNDEIPTVTADPAVPAINAIVESLPAGLSDVQLAGWAGPSLAAIASQENIAMTLTATLDGDIPAPWSVASVDGIADPQICDIVDRAIGQRAPIL